MIAHHLPTMPALSFPTSMTAVVMTALVLFATASLLVVSPHTAVQAHAASCPDIPTNDTIDLKAYTGTWYEFAASEAQRETFEKNLVCTSATYSLNDDGTIKVNNTGRHLTPNGERQTAIGKAIQVSGGKIKVSFFGPFYGPYWVIDLWGQASEGYQVSLVWSCAENILTHVQDLWILSRTPTLPAPLTMDYILGVAKSRGIDVASLNVTKTVQDGCW
jgi:apolipoprotein D and lipocalin family protein